MATVTKDSTPEPHLENPFVSERIRRLSKPLNPAMLRGAIAINNREMNLGILRWFSVVALYRLTQKSAYGDVA